MFLALFHQCRYYLKANNWSLASLKTRKFKKLLSHVEAIFKKLTELADFEKNREKIKILETTDKGGFALINDATGLCSMQIVILLTNPYYLLFRK